MPCRAEVAWQLVTSAPAGGPAHWRLLQPTGQRTHRWPVGSAPAGEARAEPGYRAGHRAKSAV